MAGAKADVAARLGKTWVDRTVADGRDTPSSATRTISRGMPSLNRFVAGSSARGSEARRAATFSLRTASRFAHAKAESVSPSAK
jgi:hypothetical protein